MVEASNFTGLNILILQPEPTTDLAKWKNYMETFCSYWYTQHYIQKGSKALRVIESPLSYLKEEQKKLLPQLEKFGFHPSTYAVKGKSFIQNANSHLNTKEILRIDLQSFYSSCTFDQVMSSVKDPELRTFILEHKTLLFITTTHQKELHIPTGSPLSPALSTLVLKSIDERFSEKIQKLRGHYTRYLDDITISFSEEKADEWKRSLKNELCQELHDDGWKISFDKTAWINPLKDSVTITGVDVRNEPKVTSRYIREKMRPALDKEIARLLNKLCSRKSYRRLLKIKTLEDFTKHFSYKLRGKLSYIKSVSPEQFDKLLVYVQKRIERKSFFYYTIFDDEETPPPSIPDLDILEISKKIYQFYCSEYNPSCKEIEILPQELSQIQSEYDKLIEGNVPSLAALFIAVHNLDEEIITKNASVREEALSFTSF